MTNLRKIQMMNEFALSCFINQLGNSPCSACANKECNGDSTDANKCKKYIRQWLISEAGQKNESKRDD